MDINDKTALLLKGFIARPSSSLIISGNEDDGVSDIIDSLCKSLLGDKNVNNRIEVHPEEGKPLVIEQARQLKKSLQTKQSTSSETGRVAVVWQADTAMSDAQNALLKLIEEPVAHSVLILQCSDTARLLSTVRSRCQLIPILPIEREKALSYAESTGISKQDALRAYTLSKGKISLYKTLLTSAGESPEHVILAKTFIQSSISDRLARVKEFESKDKLNDLITGVDTIAHAALQMPRADAEKFHTMLKEIQASKRLLRHNALTKLVFLRLCVNL